MNKTSSVVSAGWNETAKSMLESNGFFLNFLILTSNSKWSLFKGWAYERIVFQTTWKIECQYVKVVNLLEEQNETFTSLLIYYYHKTYEIP